MTLGLCQGLRRATQLRAESVAVIDGEHRFTWRETLSRIARLAGAFRALGLEEGGRVALLALNSHRSLETYFAALWAGGALTPLNHRLSVQEIVAQLADAEPALLVLGADFADQAAALREGCRSLKAVILASEVPGPADLANYEALVAATEPAPDAGRADADLACLFYTGGTTGKPKGVMLSHRNIMANSANFIAHIGMGEEAVHLHCGPLFHVAAGVRLYSVTQAAGTHVILPRFEPREVLATIARERVTLATFVPTMLRALLDQPDLEAFDLTSLQYITYGAAAMPETLLREVMARLPSVRFVQSYGMTETSPIATMLGWRDHVVCGAGNPRLRSAGRAAMLAEIAIADPDGVVQPTGATGEILIRGPMVMEGYWRQPEATALAMRNGWLRSGDVGYIDGDGYLFVVDRLKDVIITGGENVYSQEVENALMTHPAVLECAVFGMPDARWGEAVHAVVVPRDGAVLTVEALSAHCKALIAGFKCPKSIAVRSERLPLSSANKILKVQLRTEMMARRLADAPASGEVQHAG